ncbi:unnamed protein product [Echinostoma caproni]|uniref:Cilia-and flagella-associated protein 96 n=1 Tax=Echinostoma caproni TaxID=27848 RepID=A0A183AYF2_9TREM|nr:unnamed protein product [Echinostoma caproni]
MAVLSKKPDLDRIGIFREMSYHTIRDPYTSGINIVGNADAHKGRQMLVGGKKEKSALSDGYFDVFKRVFTGDYRVDYGSIIRKQRISSKKLNKGKDWVPTSYLKKIDGLGSSYGTFSGPVPYLKPTTVQFHSKTSHLKNITTSSGKKGSGSFPDIGFTPYPRHSADPFDRAEKIAEKEAAAGRSLIEKKGPFYPSVHPTSFFDSNPFRKVKLPRRTQSAYSNKSSKAPIPFKPTSPSKSDGGCKDGCFDKFPTYMSGVVRNSKVSAKSAPVFRPSYGPLPYPTTSIVDQNIKRAINSANYKNVRGVVYL